MNLIHKRCKRERIEHVSHYWLSKNGKKNYWCDGHRMIKADDILQIYYGKQSSVDIAKPVTCVLYFDNVKGMYYIYYSDNGEISFAGYGTPDKLLEQLDDKIRLYPQMYSYEPPVGKER